MLLEKLHHRLILLHLLAGFCLLLAARDLAALADVEFMDAMARYGKENFLSHLPQDNLNDRIFRIVIWLALAPFLGLAAGFVISVIQARRKKIHIINPLIMFLFGAIIVRAGTLKLPFIDYVAGPLSSLLPADYYIYARTADGLLMLGLGLFIFFGRSRVFYIPPRASA